MDSRIGAAERRSKETEIRVEIALDGVPITRYCESQPLDLRTRVQLFMRVCEAVSFASAQNPRSQVQA